MLENFDQEAFSNDEFAALGNDAVAYMREMTSEEIISTFPETPEIDAGQVFWALFAADGSPLVLASNQKDINSQAFYSDLQAVKPN